MQNKNDISFFHNALHVVNSLLLKQKKLGYIYMYLIINISRKKETEYFIYYIGTFFSEGENKFICEYNIYNNILFMSLANIV